MNLESKVNYHSVWQFLEKSRNADHNAWKEKENVTSLRLDFTQHPLYILLHITIRIIPTL